MDAKTMFRRKSKAIRDEQGKIRAQRMILEPVVEGKEITKWKFRKKRKERYITPESFWDHRYYDDPYKMFRKLMEHQHAGIETEVDIQFNDDDYWVGIPGDLFEWLTAEPERGGHTREYWQNIIDTVKRGLGILATDSIYRWRIKVWTNYNQKHRKGWGWGRHQFDCKDFNAFRVLFRLSNRAGEGEKIDLSAQLVKGGPYHKIDEDFLLNPEPKWGRTREYWQDIIYRARLAATAKPLDIEKKPIVLDPYEKEPTSIEGVTFGLADIPDDWEIELADSFVKALGKANQPWKYIDPPRQGHNVYWSDRTGFYKRLWGYHRYHKRGKQVDTGAFITKPQITELRKGIIITDEELEKAIIGFKKGSSSTPLRTRLPIHANRWWAKLFGFYYSSGAINRRIRKGKYMEVLFRIRAHEDVVPMVFQAVRAVGGEPSIQGYVPVYTKGHATGIGTTVKPTVLLPRAIFLVMQKMGLHLEFEDEKVAGKMAGRTASSNIKPEIPSWIKDNEDCMHAFLEAYINGSKGQSQMGQNRNKTHIRNWLALAILIRMSGRPREYVERFILDIKDWFNSHGVKGYFREMVRYDGKETHSWKFEFSLHSTIAWKWVLENFEIARPDLRARLYSRIEAIDNYGLYEALLSLSTPDSVLLGMIYEQHRTKKEISTALQMKEEGVVKSLQSLQKRGMIERRRNHYHYEPSVFIERFIKNNQEQSELLANRMHRFSARLLNQCQECRRVYINMRKTCGICGGEVLAVPRKGVLMRLNKERRYAKMLAFRLTTKDTEGLYE